MERTEVSARRADILAVSMDDRDDECKSKKQGIQYSPHRPIRLDAMLGQTCSVEDSRMKRRREAQNDYATRLPMDSRLVDEGSIIDGMFAVISCAFIQMTCEVHFFLETGFAALDFFAGLVLLDEEEVLSLSLLSVLPSSSLVGS